MYSSPTSLRPQGISAHLYLSAEFRDVETPSGRRLTLLSTLEYNKGRNVIIHDL